MNKIIHWCCLKEMDKLIEQWIKVDAIITDPPYWIVNDIWNSDDIEFWMKGRTSWDTIINTQQLFERCNKLLRMNWALVLFSQEPYCSELIASSHWNMPFSYRLIWKKDHFANALIAKKAPVSYFEDICVFFKSYDTEWLHPLRDYVKWIVEYIWRSKKDMFREMWHQWVCHFYRYDSMQFWLCTEKTYNELITKYWINKIEWFKSFQELKDIDKRFEKRFNLLEWKKYKSNVLEYKKDYQWLHPTQKPVALMEDLIKTYTNEWDLIIDFAAGSWTTWVAAKNLSRNFILIEKEKEYIDIINNRLQTN